MCQRYLVMKPDQTKRLDPIQKHCLLSNNISDCHVDSFHRQIKKCRLGLHVQSCALLNRIDSATVNVVNLIITSTESVKIDQAKLFSFDLFICTTNSRNIIKRLNSADV